VVSWVLARSGVSVETIHPPARGRAPGWGAGLVVAARDAGETESHLSQGGGGPAPQGLPQKDGEEPAT
jgi:hypothetical protein